MKTMSTFRKLSSLLMAVLLTASLSVTAFAEDSTVSYTGRTSGFEFEPGSVYTETDLFDGFKSVMPGDVRSEVVTIQNKYNGCDYIRVWMGALLHDETGNPISPAVLAELEADDRKGTLSELEYMHDFLDQITMTVWDGAKLDSNIIYSGSPSSLEQGFEGDKIHIGDLYYNGTATLNVELSFDIEMGNEYADRIGEVDWVFVIEERNEAPTPSLPSSEPDTPSDPGSSSEPLDPDRPITGDPTNILPYVLIFACAFVLLLVLLLLGKKKKKDDE